MNGGSGVIQNYGWQRTHTFVLLCTAFLTAGFSWGQSATSNPSPMPRRNQRIELAMKVRQPFTLVAVGDLLEYQPFSKNSDPDIQYLVNLLRTADVTTANNENMIVDLDNYTGTIGGTMTDPLSFTRLSDKDVADDWAHMGIKIVTKANNHTFEGGDEGLWEDFHQLERVGIVHAGAGRNLAYARIPRYYQTTKGLVGFVGVYAEGGEGTGGRGNIHYVTAEQLVQLRAMRDSIIARRSEVSNPIDLPAPDAEGETSVFGVTFKAGPSPGGSTERRRGAASDADASADKPANNYLRVTAYNGVTAAQMAELRAIAGATNAAGETFAAFGQKFKVMPGPGEYTYDINQEDEKDILQHIRTGKQFSSFMVVNIHWHQNRFAFQHYSFDHYPADFEIKFAHDAIDQGADAFVGHGVHTIKGIEIYKGKPIFYGVSNYVDQTEMTSAGGGGVRVGESGSGRNGISEAQQALEQQIGNRIMGQGEWNEIGHAWLQMPDNMETMLTSSHYENGRLTEVRIYPVDLGMTPRPGSELGTPKRPSPENAKKILDHIVEYSKPFGTKISIENGVGVIRIPAEERSDK